MEDQEFKDLLHSLLQGSDVTWDSAAVANGLIQIRLMHDLLKLVDTLNTNLVKFYYLVDEELNPPHQRPGGEVGLSYPDTLAGR